jgi:hypothetical protein
MRLKAAIRRSGEMTLGLNWGTQPVCLFLRSSQQPTEPGLILGRVAHQLYGSDFGSWRPIWTDLADLPFNSVKTAAGDDPDPLCSFRVVQPCALFATLVENHFRPSRNH